MAARERLDVFAVVLRAGRLWWAHWPALLAIALLGGAGRMAALWAATEASDRNNTLGVLILVLAPLSSVISIVAMLYLLRHSLPHISSAAGRRGPEQTTTHRERRLLDVLASVLVPFLAVYASYGFLKEDTDRYLNSAVADEFLNNGEIFYSDDAIDIDRFVFATGWVAVAIVVLAIVVRFGLAKLEGVRDWRSIGLIGAYVEVLWLTTLAAHFTLYKDQVWDWVETRRGIDMFAEWWLSLLDRLGPLADPVDTIAAWIGGVLGDGDAVIVVPLAWMTVGAVVYGHKLVEPARPERQEHRYLRAIPKPVRRWGGELVADLRDRFTALFGGVRQLAVAGLAPMLVFGLAFLASARVEDGLNLLARQLIGPREVDTFLAFSPHVTTVTRAIGLTVTMCLLGAAVDRVLARSAAEPDQAAREPAAIAT